MATDYEHLSVEELEGRYVGCHDATASRHFQVIWLLARGHSSGTTMLAAERTRRRGYGIEIDPIHVDTAIERWERMTGNQASAMRA